MIGSIISFFKFSFFTRSIKIKYLMYWQGEGQGSSHFRSSDSKSETSIDVSELLTQGLGHQIFFNHISVFC